MLKEIEVDLKTFIPYFNRLHTGQQNSDKRIMVRTFIYPNYYFCEFTDNINLVYLSTRIYKNQLNDEIKDWISNNSVFIITVDPIEEPVFDEPEELFVDKS